MCVYALYIVFWRGIPFLEDDKMGMVLVGFERRFLYCFSSGIFELLVERSALEYGFLSSRLIIDGWVV